LCNRLYFWPNIPVAGKAVCVCARVPNCNPRSAICIAAPLAAAPLPLAPQPRAIGHLRLSSKADNRLDGLYQAGALKAVFPRRRGAALDAVVVNTAGGITGGDRFDITASAGPNSHLTLTTQSAERAYAAQPGQTGRVTVQIDVGRKARIDWLPQETILFERCNLRRQLSVSLAADASFLMVEPLVFGRMAMGEALHAARLRDRIRIDRDGVPLYRDGLDLTGDIAARLMRSAVAGGARAMASVVLVDAQAESHLDALRDLLPDSAGVSLIGDMLVLRIVASDSFTLRQTLLPALEQMLPQTLPRCWRL